MKKQFSSKKPTGFSRDTMLRLSTPKPKDKRWIPDRPSVYWLDYIIDPTPHKLRDPEELASYYDNFEPRYPRTRLLSAPRKYYGTFYRNDDETWNRPISVTSGIPISALTYSATSRILELSKPKTAVAGTYHDIRDEKGSGIRPSTSVRSLQTGRSRSPPGKGRFFYPNEDLARGDFPSRSKHGIHSNKDRNISVSYSKSSRSRSRNSKSLDSKNKPKPIRRNPLSLK